MDCRQGLWTIDWKNSERTQVIKYLDSERKKTNIITMVE